MDSPSAFTWSTVDPRMHQGVHSFHVGSFYVVRVHFLPKVAFALGRAVANMLWECPNSRILYSRDDHNL